MRRWPYLLLGLMGFAVLLAPLIAPYDPMQTREAILQAPNAIHPLGTDALGRDVFSRLLYGGRNTLAVASLAALIALIPGVLVGLLWGMSPRRIDRIMTTIISAALAIPGLLTALVLLTLFGRGTLQIALAVGLSQIALVAQVVRGATVSVRISPYVDGAYAIGATTHHVVVRHIIPNVIPTITAYGGVVFSYSILNGAALSFLGLGELGVPDWGVMLADGRAVFDVAPWVSVFPGVAITASVFAVNTISDRYA